MVRKFDSGHLALEKHATLMVPRLEVCSSQEATTVFNARSMFFWTPSVIGSWLLDIPAIIRLTDSEKFLELLILRHQINILERQVKRPHISSLVFR